MSQEQEGAQWCLHLPSVVPLAWRPAYGPRRWRGDDTPPQHSKAHRVIATAVFIVLPLPTAWPHLIRATGPFAHSFLPLGSPATSWSTPTLSRRIMQCLLKLTTAFLVFALGKMDSVCCCSSAAELTHIHSWGPRFIKWNVLCGWPTGGYSITCGLSCFCFFFFWQLGFCCCHLFKKTFLKR